MSAARARSCAARSGAAAESSAMLSPMVSPGSAWLLQGALKLVVGWYACGSRHAAHYGTDARMHPPVGRWSGPR